MAMRICTKTGNQFCAAVVGNLYYRNGGKAVSNIAVTVNGERREIAEGLTVGEYLQLLEIPAERVAVELDRKIVKKTEWGCTRIGPGAEVEIVWFVGGGSGG